MRQTGPLQRFQSSGNKHSPNAYRVEWKRRSGKSRIKSWISPQWDSVPAEEGTSADTAATWMKSENSALTKEARPQRTNPTLVHS